MSDTKYTIFMAAYCFFRQMEFAPQYMRPIVEAIAFQMQAAVSICIIGPVADRNGEIEVRR